MEFDTVKLNKISRSALARFGNYSPTREDVEDLSQSIIVKMLEGNPHPYYAAMKILAANKSAYASGSELELENSSYELIIPSPLPEIDVNCLVFARKTIGERGGKQLELQKSLLQLLAEGVPLPRAAERLDISYDYSKKLVRRMLENVPQRGEKVA